MHGDIRKKPKMIDYPEIRGISPLSDNSRWRARITAMRRLDAKRSSCGLLERLLVNHEHIVLQCNNLIRSIVSWKPEEREAVTYDVVVVAKPECVLDNGIRVSGTM